MANFEEDSGDVLKMVTMLERHLIKGGTFDSSSTPSIEQVEEALSEAEAEMFAWLAGCGFSTSIADYPVAARKYLAWFAATDGVPPYTWSLGSGSLPTGLMLNVDGSVTGVVPFSAPECQAGSGLVAVNVQAVAHSGGG